MTLFVSGWAYGEHINCVDVNPLTADAECIRFFSQLLPHLIITTFQAC